MCQYFMARRDKVTIFKLIVGISERRPEIWDIFERQEPMGCNGERS